MYNFKRGDQGRPLGEGDVSEHLKAVAQVTFISTATETATWARARMLKLTHTHGLTPRYTQNPPIMGHGGRGHGSYSQTAGLEFLLYYLPDGWEPGR